jgi:hypothetical protein
VEVDGLAQLAHDLGAQRVDAGEQAGECGGVRKPVAAARVSRQAFVGVHEHERRLDVLARHRVPGRRKRRVEGEPVRARLDRGDPHYVPR